MPMGGCNSGINVTRQPRVSWPAPQKKHVPASVTLVKAYGSCSMKDTVSNCPLHLHNAHASLNPHQTFSVQLTLVILQLADQCVK